MPDDTFQIPDIPIAQDLLEPTEDRFYECARCALEPGSPDLCADCLERRMEHSTTGRTRKPLYHRLPSNYAQRRYLSYLAMQRDGLTTEVARHGNPDAAWTEEDLDREFPDRHEVPPQIGRFTHSVTESVVPMRWSPNSWLMPSMWASEPIVSHLSPLPPPVVADPPYALGNEYEHIERQIMQGLAVPREMLDNQIRPMGLQPGELVVLSGRRSGRTMMAAQMALRAAREGSNVTLPFCSRTFQVRSFNSSNRNSLFGSGVNSSMP